jgi:hypothetical protein
MVILSGIFFPAETDAILNFQKSKPGWTKAVEKHERTNSRLLGLFTELLSVDTETVIEELDESTYFLPMGEQEAQRLPRRKLVMQWLAPVLKSRSVEALTNTTLSTRFPKASPEVLKLILDSPLSPVENSIDKPSWLSAVNQVIKKSLSDLDELGKLDDLFVFPSATANYSFTSSAGGTLIVDQQTLEFDKSSSKDSTQSINLKQGQSYRIRMSGGLQGAKLNYFTPSTGNRSLTADFAAPASEVVQFCSLFNKLDTALQLIDTFQLSTAELGYQQSIGVSVLNPSLHAVLQLYSYSQCRRIFDAKDTCSLVQYLSSVSLLQKAKGTDRDKMTQLITYVRAYTLLPEADVKAYVDNKFYGLPCGRILEKLMNTHEMANMSTSHEIANRLKVSMDTLFQWARLPSLPTMAEDFDFALSPTFLLPNGATHAQQKGSDSLRASQQLALSTYLLSKTFFRNKKITSADGLFSYFLIDVQMGPELQTSRIGQAISAVQFFVQRCLLGREKATGILTTKIDQNKWKWMCKYNLWQANRKVFLYPENWVDPVLRDNKSQAFEALESKVMQDNLNLDTISNMIREYVYSTHDLADLEFEAYIWETTSGFRGNYHFFARTRAAPYVFYYRKLQVIGASEASVQWHWNPWHRMEVEIPCFEVDADTSTITKPGTYLVPTIFKDRVFLFIPQIIKKTLPASSANVTFEDMRTAKPNKASSPEMWEIKLGWVELRNGKWSSKQVTQSAITVKQSMKQVYMFAPTEDKLPSITSFRFRIETRQIYPDGTNKLPVSILVINVERCIEVDEVEKVPDAEPEKPKGSKTQPKGPTTKPKSPGWVSVGKFEMQGPTVTVTTYEEPLPAPKSARTAFTRLSLFSRSSTIKNLVQDADSYINALHDVKPFLALPNPEACVKIDSDYILTWRMTFDQSQYKGSAGLIVERSSASTVETFFGFPRFDDKGVVDTTVKDLVLTQSLTNRISHMMLEKVAVADDLGGVYSTLENLSGGMAEDAFGKIGAIFHELFSPCSIYNWELGFHILSLLVERLLATQQFDLALEISRQAFDPTRDDVNVMENAAGDNPSPLSRLSSCWRFPPFKSPTLRTQGSVKDIIQRLAPGSPSSTEIAMWEANPFSAHSVARQRPAVYMKRFVMKVIETLIASGDSYFRQPSLEAIPMAIQRYIEASELFGPTPQTIERPTKSVTMTYTQIKDLVNDFSTAAVDMEIDYPYFVNPTSRVAFGETGTVHQETLGFVRSTYFSVPANPQLKALRDLIDDRFHKIRSGLDINGNPRRLPLFDPPLDVGMLVNATASGESLSNVLEAIDGPMPNYRSLYLLQKATELCNELKAFADAFVAIKEKRDGEGMALLRARQDTVVQSYTGDIKDLQVQESLETLKSLEETRKSHAMRLSYYLALIGESSDLVPQESKEWTDIAQHIDEPTKDDLKMNSQESQELRLTQVSMATNTVASALDLIASGLMAIPRVITQTAPLGVGASLKMDAACIARGMMAQAQGYRFAAQAVSDGANRASRKAQLIRQLQERRLQANLAGHEVKTLDKQISAHRKRIETAQAEIKLQKQQVANMQEVESYMRSKYTSEKLYGWMETSVRQSFYQAYLAAFDVAKAAERALAFEYGPKSKQFLSRSYWDEAQNGIHSAQHLGLALRQMEAFHINAERHDYELTKTVSLRQIAPLALLRFKSEGVADFDIPEIIFDLDFPGHYCRRIKNVSVSIPCIVGPYTGINCMLRLLAHQYRLKPSTSSQGLYYGTDVTGDERFRTDRIPITAIALSNAQQDSGLFELNFHGERYIPFEGAGVISRWRIELPAPVRQFDYATMTDVIFTVRYTALDGGAIWRKQATMGALDYLKVLQEGQESGAFLMLDLKHDMPSEWAQFTSAITRSTANDSTSKPTDKLVLKLTRLKDLFPFWTKNKAIMTRHLWMLVANDTGRWENTPTVQAWSNEMILDTKDSTEALTVLQNKDLADLNMALVDGAVEIPLGNVAGKVPKNCWIVIQYTLGS